uniref:Retrovirus-related Pol polyprotein from transposon TNT 1-94 n=1 Tax=Tanacetum cinerariifolium TaxID=118510 RepID=A0A6L2JNY9_TANCI|nr:retrovirus-related Pol polyprotein from transposon TNT 1-94 [Tanacetum cinerariifolium]
MNPQGGGAAGYGGAQNRVGNVNQGQARPVKCYNCNGAGHIARNCTQPKHPLNSKYYKDKMLLMQAQENGVALDAEQLLFLAGRPDNAYDHDVDEQHVQDLALNVDNAFQSNDYNAFDSNVNEALTAQTIFMANLSSADPVTDEARPSYDSNILSEYVKDNEMPVVHSNVSSIPNDAFMMIYNDMCEPHAQSVSNPSRNTVVKNSLTAELATYKEQVELFERWANSACPNNGHEIIKDNHALAIVHNTEDTLEIAEITRKKINDKMKDPECMTRKVKIAPHDYSKENLLATFTPQKQLTLEQIFWSNDHIKFKFEALKEQTTVSRSIKALTVYPPNTPATLVPRRITPTGLTEEEMGFEQTKECYLKEAHCLALEAELANLRDKSHHDHREELINHFSKLEVNHLNLQLKYQNLKDSFRNNPPTPDKETPDFDSVFVIGKIQASLQGKDNVIRQLKKKISQLQVTSSDTDRTLKPKSHTKTNRISPAKGANKLLVEDQPRTNKSHLRTSNHVDSSSRLKRTVVQIVLWYLDSGCSKHMTEDRSRLINFIKKFIGTVRFENDHFGVIMGYGDYVIGDSVISRVYHVEGLGHNLFFVGQFCDSDLEVAFKKHSCYVRDTDSVKLIKGSRGSNLYTILIEDMIKSSSICLLSKASKNKSWLWHRRLNHLNFGTSNDLARKDLVRGLPRLKFEKDHLCSACQLGKSKKHTHKPKTKNTDLEVLHTLHMDICGPMRVQIINGKKYILVIVDDYSRLTWVKILRSKDKTPEVVIKFIQQIQVGLNKTIRYVRTDNGTEFVNHNLTEYYDRIGIFHQKTVPRTPQQNGVVERGNCTLVETARTMLIFSKALMFLWAEAVATAEDLGKLQPTADIRIFVGYAPSRKGTGLVPNLLTPGQISSGLVPNPVPVTPYVHLTNKELKILFQPMFDEYLEPSRVDRLVHPDQAVQAPVNSAGTPSSTTIDQDAPSPTISPSTSVLQSYSLHQGIATESSFMEDNHVALVVNIPFVNVFAPEPHSEASSSGDISSTESTYVSQTLHHLHK